MGKIENDIYYLSISEDGIQNVKGIRKVVIPEGIRTIGSSYIDNLPDLEEVEFPNTLQIIGKSSITRCPKLNASGLKFKNNYFYMDGINCIQNRNNDLTIMKDYVKKMIAIFNDENTTFEDKCNIYNQIVLAIHPEEEQQIFSKMLAKEFAKTNYDLSIIINKLNNKILLNRADVQCFSIFIQKMMNLQIRPMIISSYIQNIACAREDDIVEIGYDSLFFKAKKQANDIIEMNTFALYAIIHEFQHMKQRENSKNVDFNSNDLFQQLDYIDSSLQATSDSYERGHGYYKFHDISPDEIKADLDAYDMLLLLINKFSNLNYSSNMKEYIKERKIKRLIDAHQIDETGNIGIYDYRLKAFDELLYRRELSDNERERITKLRQIYIIILEKAKAIGIDFYIDELDYYKSICNEQAVHK